jgi:hypothetical protein
MKRTLIALACVLGLSLALTGTADASTLGDILKRIQQVAAAPVPAPAPAAPPVTGNSPFVGQIEAPAGVIGGTGHGCCPGTSGALGRLIFANQKGQLSCSIPFNSDIAFGLGAGVALVTFKGGDNVYGCHNDDATQVTMLNVGPPPLAVEVQLDRDPPVPQHAPLAAQAQNQPRQQAGEAAPEQRPHRDQLQHQQAGRPGRGVPRGRRRDDDDRHRDVDAEPAARGSKVDDERHPAGVAAQPEPDARAGGDRCRRPGEPHPT